MLLVLSSLLLLLLDLHVLVLVLVLVLCLLYLLLLPLSVCVLLSLERSEALRQRALLQQTQLLCYLSAASNQPRQPLGPD